MQLTIIECYGCNEIRASYKPLVSIPGNPPPSNSHSVLLLPLGRVSRPHPTAAANVASSLRRPKTKKNASNTAFVRFSPGAGIPGQHGRSFEEAIQVGVV